MAGSALLAAGCASDSGGSARVAAAQPAPGAARDLPDLARSVTAQLGAADADSLAAVELELRRISDALPAAPRAAPRQTAVVTIPPAPQPAAEPQLPPGYDAPPDLPNARSLYSALQLGAYPNQDTARAAWFGMNAAHAQALSGLAARMESVERDSGAAAYVLKAGPFHNTQEAEGLCARLRQAGAVCTAGDFTGDPL